MRGINTNCYYDELMVTGVFGPRWQCSFSSRRYFLYIVYELLIGFPMVEINGSGYYEGPVVTGAIKVSLK